MIKNIFRGMMAILGLIVGVVLAGALIKNPIVTGLSFASDNVKAIIIYILCIIILGLIFFLISSAVYKGIEALIAVIDKSTQRTTITEILFAVAGAFIALILTLLFLAPINKALGDVGKLFKILSAIVFILINLVAVIIGASISVKKKDEVIQLLHNLKKDGIKDKKSKNKSASVPKVLDTSVIIDGRIFDLCQTGFIEGPLVIPNFVLDELRHVSDSSDALKRNRGRRGLDIINKIQKELSIEVRNYEGDFPEIAEVDIKLLKLAQTLGGKVVTNDFNLNKVAEFQGVPVLNINELANAIKPVVLPGEELGINVVKEGKESGQGIAYLDDGTMIVVEGGKKYVGEDITVVVTSVLQTSAGRMIFAKKKE